MLLNQYQEREVRETAQNSKKLELVIVSCSVGPLALPGEGGEKHDVSFLGTTEILVVGVVAGGDSLPGEEGEETVLISPKRVILNRLSVY